MTDDDHRDCYGRDFVRDLQDELEQAERKLAAIRSWVDDTNELGMFAVAKLYELLGVPCPEAGCTLTAEHVEGCAMRDGAPK